MSQKSNRALIVDDDDDMRMLLRVVIEQANEGLEVVGEAADAEEGFRRWQEARPDVLVVDQRMPGGTGLELAERILAEAPDQSIILFSAYLDDDTTARAAEVGVRECVSKDDYRQIPAALWRYGPAA